VLLASVATLVLAVLGGAAIADPASDLSEAESRVASAEGDVVSAQQRVDAAQARYAAASRRADPLAAAARTARADARDMRTKLADSQREARAEIAELEEAQRQEEDDHDEEVAMGIGLGLAVLVAAAIALAWGWFRGSVAVTALVGMQLAQAAAICVGGGFLLIVIGAALGTGGGISGALGAFLFCLGFVLPIALLLGRHAAEVRDGKAKPLLGRDRLPSWVSRSAAAPLLLLGIGSLGAAIFADEPAATPVAAQVSEDAVALSQGPGAEEWEEARAEAAAAAKRAAGPVAQQRSARADLRQASGQLRNAQSGLARAESNARSAARRLEVLRKREEREAIEAQEQAEREAEEQEELEPEEPESSGCEPGYSPCVPTYPPDVDCAEVGGSVTVTGSDPHGLDADGDGTGCE